MIFLLFLVLDTDFRANKDFEIGDEVLVETPLITFDDSRGRDDYMKAYIDSSPEVKEKIMDMASLDISLHDQQTQDLASKHKLEVEIVAKLLNIRKINAHSFKGDEKESNDSRCMYT